MSPKADGGDPPIFVVGLARSGTTLLQACLGAHPRIAAPPETYFVLRIAGLADFYGDLTDDDRLRRAVRDTLDSALLAPLGVDEQDLFERASRGRRDYAGLFAALMEGIAAARRKARWCDKSPGQPARAIWRLFPDAQVVHIVRHPLDFAASSLEAPWISLSPAELGRRWSDFNLDQAAAGDHAGSARYLRLRYEDLVADPESTLRRVCGFLVEDFDPSMTDPESRSDGVTITALAEPWQHRAIKPIDEASVGRGRGRLTSPQRASVLAAARRGLEPLGYPAADRWSIITGILHNSLAGIPRWRGALHRVRSRRAALTPSERYERVQLLMSESERAIASSRPSPPLTAGGTTT